MASRQASACRACGGGKIEDVLTLRSDEWGDDDRFGLKRCRRCGLGFLDPQPTDEFLVRHVYNDAYPLYDFDWVGKLDNSILRRAYRTVFPHPLIRLIPRAPGTALDVGCGSGYWMEQLRRRGWRVVGMDTSLGSIEQLKRMGFEGICGSVEDVDLGNEEYDLILLSAVLEHLHDPERTLRKVHAALKEDGRVVIDVPNFGSVEVGLFGQHWSMLGVGHLFYFTETSMRAFLAKTGFVSESFRAQSAELTFGYSLARKLSLRGRYSSMLGAPLQVVVNELDAAGELFCSARKAPQ